MNRIIELFFLLLLIYETITVEVCLRNSTHLEPNCPTRLCDYSFTTNTGQFTINGFNKKFGCDEGLRAEILHCQPLGTALDLTTQQCNTRCLETADSELYCLGESEYVCGELEDANPLITPCTVITTQTDGCLCSAFNTTWCFYDFGEYHPDNDISEICLDTLGHVENIIRPEPENIYVNLVNETLKFEATSDFNGIAVFIDKGIFTTHFLLNGTVFFYTLPDAVFDQNGFIEVVLRYPDGRLVLSKTFSILGNEDCKLNCVITCPLRAWNQRNCTDDGSVEIFFFIMSLSIVWILIMTWLHWDKIWPFLKWFIPAIFWFAIAALMVLPMCCCNFMMGKSYIAKKLKMYTQKFVSMFQKDETMFNILSKNTSMNFKYVILMYLIVAISFCLACDVGVVQNIDTNQCSIENNVQSCNLNLETVITIPRVGGKVCLHLNDINNPSDNFGTMEFEYTHFLVRVLMNEWYKTRAYTVKQNSIKECHAPHTIFGDINPKHTKCTNSRIRNLDPQDPTFGGVVNNRAEYIQWPGPQEFTRFGTTDCALSGFNPEPNCVYTAAAVWPTGPLYSVFAPGTTTRNAHLVVRLTVNNGTMEFPADLSANVVQRNDFTFQVIGTFGSLSTPNFGNVLYQANTDQAYFEDVAPRGILSGTTWGAIQAATADLLTITNSTPPLARRNAFSVPLDIFGEFIQGPIHGEWAWNTFSGTTNNPLPRDFEGNLVFFDGRNLVYNATDPGALEVRITSPPNYRISRFVTVVCPSITLVNNPTGCMSCDEGISLTVSGISTCDSGMATITALDPDITVHTKSIRLTKTTQNFVIRLSTDKIDNSFTLRFSGRNQHDDISVNFIAHSGISLNNSTRISTDIAQRDSEQTESDDSLNWHNWFSGWFDDLFLGNLEWWEYLITIPILILICCSPLALFFLAKKTNILPLSRGSSFIKRE